MGLINRAVPGDQLDATVEQAASAIAAKAPDAIALGKAVFNRQIEAPLDEAYAIASAAMVENLGFESARSGIDGFPRGNAALGAGGSVPAVHCAACEPFAVAALSATIARSRQADRWVAALTAGDDGSMAS